MNKPLFYGYGLTVLFLIGMIWSAQTNIIEKTRKYGFEYNVTVIIDGVEETSTVNMAMNIMVLAFIFWLIILLLLPMIEHLQADPSTTDTDRTEM